MKKFVLGLLILIAACTAVWVVSEPARPGCFEEHIREAMTLNRARMPLYSQLTQGRSEKVSKIIVFEEALALPLARYFDWRAGKYQKAGIPVLCDDFVAMSLVPEFKTGVSALRSGPYQPVDTSNWVQEIRAAERSGGLEGMTQVIDRRLAELSRQPAFHCMLRHLLESVHRAARLSPRYHAAALHAGLDSPQSLSLDFIRMHLFSLGQAAWIDEMAAPFQAQGVAIICQDVPPITSPAPNS